MGWRVTALVLLLIAAGCGGGGEDNSPIGVRETHSSPPDFSGPVEALEVSLSSPVDGAVNVPVDAGLRLEFSRPPTDLGGVTLVGPSGPVAATVAPVGAGGQVALTPAAPLAPGTPYQVWVAAGTPADDGSVLAKARVWGFTTAAVPGTPEVAPLPPAGGGGVWSAGAWVDPLGATTDVTLSIGGDTVRWTIGRRTALYASPEALEPDRVHTLRVTADPVGGGPGADSTLAFATGWADVTPRGLTAAPLRDLALLTGERAFAVGAGGTLIATADGGATWTRVDTGTPADLEALTFLGPTSGWAVGAGGTLLHTVDGSTWEAVPSGTTADLHDVAFHGAIRGIAVGDAGTILLTTDGGATWIPLHPIANGHLHHIVWESPTLCRVVGDYGTILVTLDGGATWAREAAVTGADLLGITVTADGYRWAVGEGGIVLVGGGGSDDWVVRGATGQPEMRDVVFADTRNGWAAGTGQSLIHTADGGASWSVQSLPVPGGIRALSARDDHRLMAVGQDEAGGPLVLVTDTGGAR